MTRTPIARRVSALAGRDCAALRRSSSAVRIRVENPAYVHDLAASLSGRVDAVVREVNERELEVNLLGSYMASQLRLELEHRLRIWRLRHPLAVVSIVDEDDPEVA
jgi:hypothetical protein